MKDKGLDERERERERESKGEREICHRSELVWESVLQLFLRLVLVHL